MIRIATWNIGEDESNEKNIVNLKSYEYIKNMILKENVDIICLQEATTTSDYIIPISKFIKENTNLKYACEFELSKSHINIECNCGVVICSKFPISKHEKVFLDNPNITYKKNEVTTYYSFEKGFVIANIKSIPLSIINIHCLPFHIFKKSPLEYISLYKKAEKKFIETLKNSKNIIFTGDVNYTDINQLFPEFMKLTSNTIKGKTRGEDQLDYIACGNNIKVLNSEIIDRCFDHRICITTLDL
jgi:exonuclease III